MRAVKVKCNSLHFGSLGGLESLYWSLYDGAPVAVAKTWTEVSFPSVNTGVPELNYVANADPCRVRTAPQSHRQSVLEDRRLIA